MLPIGSECEADTFPWRAGNIVPTSLANIRQAISLASLIARQGPVACTLVHKVQQVHSPVFVWYGELYKASFTEGHWFERAEAVRRVETITCTAHTGPQVYTLATTTLVTLNSIGLQVTIARVRAAVTLWLYAVWTQGSTQVKGTTVDRDAVNAANEIIWLDLPWAFQ